MKMNDFARARQNMVLCQLNTSGVLDPRIVDAFMNTPREYFLPSDKQAVAYVDDQVAVGGGRFLLEPLVLARLVQAAAPLADQTALSIGGTTGYGAAILSQLAESVIDFESGHDFDGAAQAAQSRLGLYNITRTSGDMMTGRDGAETGGYDVIIAEGAYAEAPVGLYHLLKPGGRLCAVIVPDDAAIGQAYLYQKDRASGHVSARPLFDAWAPYAPGCGPVRRFVFG